MSTRARPELVQELLAERRQLMVTCERLRLELTELRQAAGRPDPRLERLEESNRRLREELAGTRTRLQHLEAGVLRALREMEKASR